MAARYKREGFRDVSPYILAADAAGLLRFLQAAFGAQASVRVPGAEGRLVHAEARLGDCTLELSDGNERFAPAAVTAHLTLADHAAAYRAALDAGAVSLYAPGRQFWGEEEAGVRDPWGNEWYLTSPDPRYPQPAVQPYLHLRDTAGFGGFVERAFGARAEGVHEWMPGVVAHATVVFGDGQIEIDEAFRANRAAPCTLHLYVPDADAAYARAVAAGAEPVYAPLDKPYGDREGGVRDPWGNVWFVATARG